MRERTYPNSLPPDATLRAQRCGQPARLRSRLAARRPRSGSRPGGDAVRLLIDRLPVPGNAVRPQAAQAPWPRMGPTSATGLPRPVAAVTPTDPTRCWAAGQRADIELPGAGFDRQPS